MGGKKSSTMDPPFSPKGSAEDPQSPVSGVGAHQRSDSDAGHHALAWVGAGVGMGDGGPPLILRGARSRDALKGGRRRSFR